MLATLTFVAFSCKNAKDNAGSSKSKPDAQTFSETAGHDQTYEVDAATLTADFMTWYKYTYANIRLEQNFVGRDTDGENMEKILFLDRLSTGEVIALKVAQQEDVAVYQLYQPAHPEPDIQRTSVEMAQRALIHAHMQGKELPDYRFTDINGQFYDKNNTKGKVLLVKCWFIHCTACVKEFPVLNQLVDRYQNRNDVQFISLASDSKHDLQTFLKKKPFRYAVVPEMGAYMQEKLNVNAYPMHLLIDREGKIVKATNAIEDLIPSLEKEME